MGLAAPSLHYVTGNTKITNTTDIPHIQYNDVTVQVQNNHKGETIHTFGTLIFCLSGGIGGSAILSSSDLSSSSKEFWHSSGRSEVLLSDVYKR